MIGLLQRVVAASVQIDQAIVAQIDTGLVVLVGVQRNDDSSSVRRLVDRLLTYRVFADDAGRMNRSLLDVDGDLLLVPQFTLAADTRKGTRAGFSTAAEPARGRELFETFVAECRRRARRVESGIFGAHMRVQLVNDGPVTFWLEVSPGRG
jgi:D-tyrosyl-tRNA(Tyr) deacylase